METEKKSIENHHMSKQATKKNHRKRVESPFAQNLQKVLKERGISLRVAANIAGVSQSVISSWLAGAQPADLNAVHKFARSTGTDFEWLVVGHLSGKKANSIPLNEIFEEQEAFSGIYQIEAKKLVRKEFKADET